MDYGEGILGLRDFVVFDLETTGLDKICDSIIEVGAVRLLDGKILERFQSFVNFPENIPANIIELTGINDEMVAEAPCIEEVLRDFKRFIGDSPVVAHNAGFDWGFIQEKAECAGVRFDNKVYDTLYLSRKLIPGLAHHDLGTLCRCFGVENKDHHRADNDAEVLAQVFLIFLDAIKKRGISLDDV